MDHFGVLMIDDVDKFHILRGEHVLVLKSLTDTDSSTLTHSIPLNYGTQIPIMLKADGDFLSYRILQQNHHNKAILFDLPPLKENEETKIHFEYWVLAKKINYEDILNKEKIPVSVKNLPEFTKKYLVSTKSIQSDSIFIKIMSLFLKGFNRDLLWFVKKVMFWNAYHGTIISFLKRQIVIHPILNKLFLPDQYWIRLEDAISTLFLGGVCAGQTNLGVALLRAQNIPARVLIATSNHYGKDTWLDSQHYMLEFYYPSYGWIPAFSGRVPSPSKNDISLRIISIDEENIAGNGVSMYGGEAPWFWIDNENIVLGKPEGFMEYKLPKTKKTGVPAVRGWKEDTVKIPKEISNKLIEITKEVWELFTKNAGIYNSKNQNLFDKAMSLQEKSITLLTQSKFEEYIKTMEEVRAIFQNF